MFPGCVHVSLSCSSKPAPPPQHPQHSNLPPALFTVPLLPFPSAVAPSRRSRNDHTRRQTYVCLLSELIRSQLKLLFRVLRIGMTQEEIEPHAPTYLAVWLFFQIAAGHVALPILAATLVFAKSVRKVPALVVVCITWIISGISSTLL